MSRESRRVAKLLTLFLLGSVASFADVITGPFTITGTAQVGATSVVFNPDSTVATNTPSDPAAPAVGSSVTIGPLNEATTPVGTSFPADTNWLTVGDVALDLTFLPAGIDPAYTIGTGSCGLSGGSVGDLCTPIIPNSPTFLSNFNLQNIAGPEFTASFTVDGTARDLAGGANNVDSFQGSFTATLPGTYQSVLAEIAAGQTPTFTYAGQFTFTSVPEPGYLGVLGAGLILFVAVGLRRRFQQAA
jgi:hypothetical protein